MKEAAKRIARLGPFPALRRVWQRAFGWRWFRGSYASWAEARAASAGYDDAAVFKRVLDAACAVRAGRAAWERDGALFAEPMVHTPLLAALREIAAERGGRLDVIDFGGALGSTWWQHRAALADLRVTWCVVEQPQFVETGKAEFTGDGLRFASTIAAAGEGMEPAVILFSSVLPYLENPQTVLAGAVASGVPHVIIDRTPFWSGGRDWLTVQRTPPGLGGGSYPAWVFDQASLLAPLAEKFEIAAEWPGFDVIDPRMEYRGLHWTRKAVIT
jgi:putative methyltransferase (TIGR04325 family)